MWLERVVVDMLAVDEGGLVSTETLLEGAWGEPDVLLGRAGGLSSAPVDKFGGNTEYVCLKMSLQGADVKYN